jgi:hypothetical protein
MMVFLGPYFSYDVFVSYSHGEPHGAGDSRLSANSRRRCDINAEGQPIRRPRSLLDLTAVCAIPTDRLRGILDVFRAEGASFVTSYLPADRQAGSGGRFPASHPLTFLRKSNMLWC